MRQDLAHQGDAGGDPKASAALRKFREERLARFDDPDSVCFGRLDFEQGDQHYVGRQSVSDEHGDLIVINWRADAAKPFYEATPDDPMGLSLRRRFRALEEKLLGLSDEVFGTAGAVEPTITDFLLEELGRERTAEMRDIAATIQREQYRIISRPLDSTTIVQGGPGTGKTVVGLHRAAFLLYRHRDTLVPSRVLVVGPNRLFMHYIRFVLPSLGETAADQFAIDGLGQVTPSMVDDALVARVKGDERMAEVLRKAVVDRVRAPSEDIEFSANGVRFSVPPAIIQGLIGDFNARDASYTRARERFRSDFEAAAAKAFAAARGWTGDAPSVNIRRLPEFDRALDRIWPTITAPELVRQLLASEASLERATQDVLTDTERRLLYRKPVERLEQVDAARAGRLVGE
jgi:DNA helicase IV